MREDPDDPLGPFFSEEALRVEYEKLRSDKYDPFLDQPKMVRGEDGIFLETFDRDKEKHLRAISRKVLQGRYTFKRWRVVPVPKGPKSKNETRDIAVAGIRDALVQRAIYNFVYDTVDADQGEQSFGFRKGRSSHQAVRKIQEHFESGHTVVLDADIRKFFDSVPHDKLLRKFDAFGFDPRIERLVRRFLATGYRKSWNDNEGPHEERRHSRDGVGLPQGGVLSGLLANLYLAEFDRNVTEKVPGLVRYADDFVVCCKSPLQCQLAYSVAQDELRKLDLSLHPDKTKQEVLAENGVDFLGFRITPTSLRVRESNIQKFKSRVNEVIEKWWAEDYENPAQAFYHLIRKINFKVRGPGPKYLRRMISMGLVSHEYRRNWPSYFRIVDDDEQFKELDRWIRRRVSQAMIKKHNTRATFKDMKNPQLTPGGLHSLVNTAWRARKPGTKAIAASTAP